MLSVAFGRKSLVSPLALMRCFSGHASLADAKKTPLYDWHVAQAGTVVNFCGYALPVVYKSLTIMQSVFHTRTSVSLFDVSHMGQLLITGKDRVKVMERLTPANLKPLKLGKVFLTQITNAQGGIMDDTMIANRGEVLGMVVNAACKEADIKYLMEKAAEARDDGLDMQIHPILDRALLAVQGPKAMEVLARHTELDLTTMPFMSTKPGVTVCGVPDVTVTRCGYTGEDGFEIAIPEKESMKVADMLSAEPEVKPAGLGARDSLRLEAGLCLMGSDMDATTTPVEAALNFTLQKRRRTEGGFIGAEVVIAQLKEGVKRLRVGMFVTGAPAREGAPIFNPDGELIGKVTSGGFSPMLKKNIAMGYVPPAFAATGSSVLVEVRGNKQPASVTPLPFVPTKYYRGGSK